MSTERVLAGCVRVQRAHPLCATCPHRKANANLKYRITVSTANGPVQEDGTVLGADLAGFFHEPHECHETLDENGEVTLDTLWCAGWRPVSPDTTLRPKLLQEPPRG